MRGEGRVVFAAVLLMIAGVLNIIYGFGAIDGANIFTDDARYILTNLNTMGWLLVIVGIVQLIGGISLWSGNPFGRVIGVIAGSISAIVALLSIGGAFPWWSLGIFFLSIWIVYGILVYGSDDSELTS